MELAQRRKALGYSQESFAQALGVDRTTVGRWESGKATPQPQLRLSIAELLRVDVTRLGDLLSPASAIPTESAGPPPPDRSSPGSPDDMLRREFLRAIAVTSALIALPADEADALADEVSGAHVAGFARMNEHLWQVYQLARAKGSVQPIVQEQLSALNQVLTSGPSRETTVLCSAAGDLFQLAGELAFDSNRYTDAAASYTIAASASKEAGNFDLWACALVRHAYVDVCEGRYKDASGVLTAAERIARRGDSSLSTRYWVASVQAEIHAGLGNLDACERALDQAEKVATLSGRTHNGGWLRFDGSRLAEERGARYVRLGRLDLAEQALTKALEQGPLAQGHSFRRRGAVLTDLAAIGARRGDPDQVVSYGWEALRLARESGSGYVARRLDGLRTDLGELARDVRVAELASEIEALKTT
ncbi:helix-turn-helix domain-containing protein [Streptomyces sp. NBC_01235]|nr:helix-turn-helix domain-containing protein [Streptomyces sp. NBC_01235]